MSAQNLAQEISRLRLQNISDDEIASQLLYKGYSNADIFDAMSETTYAFEQPMEKMEYTQDTQGFSYPQLNAQPPQMQQAYQDSSQSIDSNKIAEIAESIIEDKWSDLIDHVNKIIEWKASVEQKVILMDEQIKTIKSNFDNLQKAILGRINDSDTVMSEVSTDIKALEQVFKKILPGFVENVNELSRITQNLKKK